MTEYHLKVQYRNGALKEAGSFPDVASEDKAAMAMLEDPAVETVYVCPLTQQLADFLLPPQGLLYMWRQYLQQGIQVILYQPWQGYPPWLLPSSGCQ